MSALFQTCPAIPTILIALLNVAAVSKLNATQIEVVDSASIVLPTGFSAHSIRLMPRREAGGVIGTLYKIHNTSVNKIAFVSRKLFVGDFDFDHVEKAYSNNEKQVVLQVASAFTPDWKVIEGYALQNGIPVGQDSFLGENEELIYDGILEISGGKSRITRFDSIGDKRTFTASAIENRHSLFMQISAIIESRINEDIDLPGEYKRRYFVEYRDAEETGYGIIDFTKKMKYRDSVDFMHQMTTKDFEIVNALYLDTGAVLQGYVYDKDRTRRLLGDSGKDMLDYTNLLVIYKDTSIRD